MAPRRLQKALGRAERLARDVCVCVLRVGEGMDAAIYFKAWRGKVA